MTSDAISKVEVFYGPNPPFRVLAILWAGLAWVVFKIKFLISLKWLDEVTSKNIIKCIVGLLVAVVICQTVILVKLNKKAETVEVDLVLGYVINNRNKLDDILDSIVDINADLATFASDTSKSAVLSTVIREMEELKRTDAKKRQDEIEKKRNKLIGERLIEDSKVKP